MGATASHDFANPIPGGGQGPIGEGTTIPVWTKEDVQKSWADEEALTNDLRRKRYRCGRNFVTIADIKSWDCQIQGATSFAVGNVQHEIKEQVREARRKVLRKERRDKTLAETRKQLEAKMNKAEFSHLKDRYAKLTDNQIVNELALGKWNPDKVVERLLGGLEDEYLSEKTKAEVQEIVRKRDPKTQAKLEMPSEMELRTLMFMIQKGYSHATKQIVELIDRVYSTSKNTETLSFEDALRFLRIVEFASVDAAFSLFEEETKAAMIVNDKVAFLLHEGLSEAVDMAVVRDKLRMYNNSVDDATMAYSKDKNRKDKAVKELKLKLDAKGVETTENELRQKLAANFWIADIAFEKWSEKEGKEDDAGKDKSSEKEKGKGKGKGKSKNSSSNDSSSVEEEKKAVSSTSAASTSSSADGTKNGTTADAGAESKSTEPDPFEGLEENTWEYMQKKAEVAHEREMRIRDTPLVPVESPCEPDTEINKLVSVWNGDITTLEVDGILNAANSTLLGGGGIDGAIHKAAGKKLMYECATLGGATTGQTKITRGYNLPARFVLHTVGPIGEDRAALEACYTSALDVARENRLRTIALCAVSTGIYGYPLHSATHVALYAVRRWLESEVNRRYIKKIIFCTFMPAEHIAYMRLAPYYFPGPGMNTYTNIQRYVTMKESYGDPADDSVLQEELKKMTWADLDQPAEEQHYPKEGGQNGCCIA